MCQWVWHVPFLGYCRYAYEALSLKPDQLTETTPDASRETAQVAAAQKDLAAFDELYLTYAENIFRYLYSRVGERADAEELTAQTFLAAMEKFSAYTHRGHFAAWLFSIARNKAIDHYRRGRRYQPIEEAEMLTGESDLLAEVAGREQRRALLAQVSQLSDAEQELLRLRYVANLNFSQIAVVLERSEAAVKKNLYRCLERLQSKLEVSYD